VPACGNKFCGSARRRRSFSWPDESHTLLCYSSQELLKINSLLFVAAPGAPWHRWNWRRLAGNTSTLLSGLSLAIKEGLPLLTPNRPVLVILEVRVCPHSPQSLLGHPKPAGCNRPQGRILPFRLPVMLGPASAARSRETV
jgi:hypothetical protein